METLEQSIGKNPERTAASVRIVCSILVTHDREIIQRILSCHVLDIFNGLLATSAPILKREIFWGLSNLACQSNEVARALVDHPIYEQIKAALADGDVGIRREAIVTMSYILTEWQPPNLVFNLIQSDQEMFRQYLKNL